MPNHQWPISHERRPNDQTIWQLRRLAAEAEIAAETTVDPNRKRALRALALKYRRLADFVRNTPVGQ